jgi:hypothetical protein
MANRRSIQQSESGLDELVSYRARSQPRHGPHGLDEAAKRKWANCDLYEVWQLVALHSGVDPDSLGTSPEVAIRALRYSEFGDALQRLIGDRPKDQPIDRLKRNLRDALRALREGKLKPLVASEHLGPDTLVDVHAFSEWARQVALPKAGPWISRNGDVSFPDEWRAAFPRRTPMLEQLLAVASHFAQGYWEGTRASVPTVPEVIDYAVAEFEMNAGVAETFAQILRPAGLKKGRLPHSAARKKQGRNATCTGAGQK